MIHDIVYNVWGFLDVTPEGVTCARHQFCHMCAAVTWAVDDFNPGLFGFAEVWRRAEESGGG